MTVIQATLRSAQGTGASRRLRNENKVPAVVYGLGESKAISVDHKFRAAKRSVLHASAEIEH